MLSNHCAEPSIIRKSVTCYSPVEKNVTMVKEDSTAGELGRFCTILNTRSMLIDTGTVLPAKSDSDILFCL